MFWWRTERVVRDQNRGALTVLGDEGEAAVHDDGDVVPAQLLLPQGVPLAAGRPLDVRVPQREVGAAEAPQVQSPGGREPEREEKQNQTGPAENRSPHLPFSTRTRMSFLSGFSVSEVRPSTTETFILTDPADPGRRWTGTGTH